MYIVFLFIIFGVFACSLGTLDFAVKGKVPKFSMGIFLCFLFAITWSARPVSMGTDTLAYADAYKNAPEIGGIVRNNFEIGFNFIMSAGKELGLSFFWFQFVCLFLAASLFLSAYFLVLKNYVFAISITLLSPFFFSLTINILRQGLAAGFLAVAVAAFLGRSRLLGGVLFLFAVSMHITALALFAFFILVLLFRRPSLLFFIVFAFYSAALSYIARNLEIVIDGFKYFGIDGKPLRRLVTYSTDPDSTRVGTAVLLDATLLAAVFYNLLRQRRLQGIDGYLDQYRQTFVLLLFSLFGLIFYVSFSDYGILSRLAIYTYFAIVVVFVKYFVSIRLRPRMVFALVFLLLTWIKLGLVFKSHGYFSL
jgi:hypothetical protein